MTGATRCSTNDRFFVASSAPSGTVCGTVAGTVCGRCVWSWSISVMLMLTLEPLLLYVVMNDISAASDDYTSLQVHLPSVTIIIHYH